MARATGCGAYGVQTDDSGLIYMRARYYSPELMRFISEDTVIGSLDKVGSLNRYAFCGGNPVGYVDPSGNERTDTGTQPTTVSDGLVKFLMQYESYQAKPYYATADEKAKGKLTIGYGHLVKEGENYTYLTQEEAFELLKKDIESHIPTYLMEELTENGVYLTQNQFDALVSLCFNCGPNILKKEKSPTFHAYLLKGDFTAEKTLERFMQYTKQDGAVLKGLVKRRKAEANMFTYGIYN